jgi:hypothetical protein
MWKLVKQYMTLRTGRASGTGTFINTTVLMVFPNTVGKIFL